MAWRIGVDSGETLDATTVVLPGMTARVQSYLNLIPKAAA
jgi:hypothetical protein